MYSPTHALVWEIWRRHRLAIGAIAGLTVAGRLLDFLHRAPALVELLAMLSFLLLFGIFKTRVPRRLFTLPVSSLRVIAVPMLSGIVSVEILYLLWMGRWSRVGFADRVFAAVLAGSFIVFYQAILWTLEVLGPVRLVVAAAVAAVMFGVGVTDWRSEGVTAAVIAAATIVAFLVAWRHVARVRRGDARVGLDLSVNIPSRRTDFQSRLAAHYWFEWRSAGVVLPTLVGAAILFILGPLSWFVRHDAAGSFRVLCGALALPVVLAIPVGMAFGKPSFWSEELSVPAFIAVRPVSDEEIISTKLKVAIGSAILSWLFVLAFLALWSCWANLDLLMNYRRAPLIVVAGMFLTWRFLVSSLWSAMSGKRGLFIASAMSIVVVVIAGVALDVDRFPVWLHKDPAHMSAIVWLAVSAVVVKYTLAIRLWRDVPARYALQYLMLWAAGTACFVALAVVYRSQSLMILIALLAMPAARVGKAPSFLARNRHRI